MMSRSIFALLGLLLCSLINMSSARLVDYDLLIRNGRIVDGSGRPAYNADLAVKGDRIVRVGDLSGATATRIIDARGLVVAPGFIDMLGQSESYLLIDPRAMSKVMQGVTTEVTGEGESIAPINERQIREQEGFLRRFNLKIDWRTLDDYFKRLEKQGKRVSEIAQQQKKDPLDTVFDLLLADQGQTGAIYFMMSEADMRTAMQAPFVSFCTDSGARATDGPLAGSKSHPRGWGTYPRILGRYVREARLLSLEAAIHKMTGAPAARVRLRERGLLREGMFADITILDPRTVMDRATFESPNQYPIGIEYVLVNGQLSVDKGQRTPALAGRVLRGPGCSSC